MFLRSKRRESGTAKAVPRPSAAPSLISHDLRVIGDLLSDGDLQIDGLVEGDVRSRNVTVGENAVVKGSIAAQKARIRGHVEGEITARSVALAKSATVQGDILHESISIEAGAYIDGRCRRFDEQAQLDDHTDIRGALWAPRSDDADGPATIEHQPAAEDPSVNPFAAAGRTGSVIHAAASSAPFPPATAPLGADSTVTAIDPDQDGPDQDGPDQDGPDQDGPDQDGPDQDGANPPTRDSDPTSARAISADSASAASAEAVAKTAPNGDNPLPRVAATAR